MLRWLAPSQLKIDADVGEWIVWTTLVDVDITSGLMTLNDRWTRIVVVDEHQALSWLVLDDIQRSTRV